MSESNEITPRTITELKQVKPEEISLIAEGVLEATTQMTKCSEELENLSESLNGLAYAKQAYDKHAKTVKKQMRELIPIL